MIVADFRALLRSWGCYRLEDVLVIDRFEAADVIVVSRSPPGWTCLEFCKSEKEVREFALALDAKLHFVRGSKLPYG